MDGKHIKLSELQSRIRNAIDSNFINSLWFTAEISEIKINYSGHYYLELVEKDPSSDNIIAKIKAIIWNRQARFLLPYFRTTTGSDLAEGLILLASGKPEYHPVYGLSIIINDIDPAYTIGDLARKRNEIISRLEKDGVISMNQELEMPLFPKNIAVVSSGEAAGYEDFCKHLENNPYNYRFNIRLFKAVMQGETTERSVINALNEISDNIESFDVAVIVRGGGSQTDLSWFDNYNIAYFITQLPIPVITGIGHDKDFSVTDMVAHTSCKTPTAVADLITEHTMETEKYFNSLCSTIVNLSLSKIENYRRLIERAESKISGNSMHLILKKRSRLNILKELIQSNTKREIQRLLTSLYNNKVKLVKQSERTLSDKKAVVNNLRKSIDYLDPLNTLKRGYSITKYNGKTRRDTKGISKDDIITTILYKGKIESKVFEIKE